MKYLYDLTDDEADIFEKLEDGEEGTLEERKIYLKVLRECWLDAHSRRLMEQLDLRSSVICSLILLISLFLWGFNEFVLLLTFLTSSIFLVQFAMLVIRGIKFIEGK